MTENLHERVEPLRKRKALKIAGWTLAGIVGISAIGVPIVINYVRNEINKEIDGISNIYSQMGENFVSAGKEIGKTILTEPPEKTGVRITVDYSKQDEDQSNY